MLRVAVAALVPASVLLSAACAAPTDPVKVPPPPADVTDCRACHAGKGAYPLAADVYKLWETSGHGRFLNRPEQRPTCEACHDLKGAAAGHLDGLKNAPGPNIYHLVPGSRPGAEERVGVPGRLRPVLLDGLPPAGGDRRHASRA